MRHSLYIIAIVLSIVAICMVGFNLYLTWILSEMLINIGFGAPDLAVYLGSIIRNAILIIITSIMITIFLDIASD